MNDQHEEYHDEYGWEKHIAQHESNTNNNRVLEAAGRRNPRLLGQGLSVSGRLPALAGPKAYRFTHTQPVRHETSHQSNQSSSSQDVRLEQEHFKRSIQTQSTTVNPKKNKRFDVKKREPLDQWKSESNQRKAIFGTFMATFKGIQKAIDQQHKQIMDSLDSEEEEEEQEEEQEEEDEVNKQKAEEDRKEGRRRKERKRR
jgi:hypothetical protein